MPMDSVGVLFSSLARAVDYSGLRSDPTNSQLSELRNYRLTSCMQLLTYFGAQDLELAAAS